MDEIIYHEGNEFVDLGYVPEEDVEKTIGHAIHKINPKEDGMCMDVLIKAIVDYLPKIENPETYTTKEILFVERYECPCCATSIDAIVRIHTEGLMVPEARNVEGLYEVWIHSPYSDPQRNAQVFFKKLESADNKTESHIRNLKPVVELDKPLERRNY